MEKKLFINAIAIVVISISVFCSCQKDKFSVEMQSVVKEWMGKEIIFPQKVSCTSINKDIPCISRTSTPYKILVYTDSIGCMGCKLDLYKWNILIEEVREEMQDSVIFQFYFHPKSIKELQFLFRRDTFKYPSYIDTDDKLNKINNLPKNNKFQTFLLDRNNKVILIGNPANNPQIWNLYKQRIRGKKNKDSSNINNEYPITSLNIDNPILELKRLVKDKTTTVKFLIKNTGSNPLIITNVSTTCGCTVPKWSKQPVLPNDITEISLQITPDAEGFFRKIITVYCNTEKRNVTLVIKGLVKS